MDKKTSERFKQLIGESKTEDKMPLMSEGFVTDDKLATYLSEKESKESDAEKLRVINENFDKELEALSVISEVKTTKKPVITESKKAVVTESDDETYELDFLNEDEEK